MEKIRLYHIDRKEEARNIVKSFVSKQTTIRLVGSTSHFEEGLEEIDRIFPDVVIIDENISKKDLTQHIEKILQHSPYLGLIVSTSQHKNSKMKKYMNMGARDFLSKPFNATELIDSVLKVNESVQKIKDHIVKNSTKILMHSPQMVTVFSTKGGVGKSIISSLIASGLSSIYREKTAIVDLDLQFGDISLLLDIKPSSTITNVSEVIERLEPEDMKKLLYKHNSGLNILASPLKPEESEFITEEALHRMFSILKKEYDYIIVDTPRGFTDQTIVALEHSDMILFVTTPDLISLKNTKAGILTLKEVGIDVDKVKIIVNRFNSKNTYSLPLVKEILQKPIFAVIREDYPNLMSFVNRGQPQAFFNSKGIMRKDIIHLIESLRQFHMVTEGKKKRRMLHLPLIRRKGE